MDYREDYVHYSLPSFFLERIQDLCAESGHFLPRNKRKPSSASTAANAKAANPAVAPVTLPAPSAASLPATSAATVTTTRKVDSIYDDDEVEDASSAVGAAAAVTPIVPSSSSSYSSADTAKHATGSEKRKRKSIAEENSIVWFSEDEGEGDREMTQPSLKGLFRNLKPAMPSAPTATGSVPATATAAPEAKKEADVLQPVREMLIAQATREKLAKAQREREREREAAAAATAGERGREKESFSSVVNRDVFATTKDKVVLAEETQGPQGDVFGLKGDYDLYPETGEYDVSQHCVVVCLHFPLFILRYTAAAERRRRRGRQTQGSLSQASAFRRRRRRCRAQSRVLRQRRKDARPRTEEVKM